MESSEDGKQLPVQREPAVENSILCSIQSSLIRYRAICPAGDSQYGQHKLDSRARFISYLILYGLILSAVRAVLAIACNCFPNVFHLTPETQAWMHSLIANNWKFMGEKMHFSCHCILLLTGVTVVYFRFKIMSLEKQGKLFVVYLLSPARTSDRDEEELEPSTSTPRSSAREQTRNKNSLTREKLHLSQKSFEIWSNNVKTCAMVMYSLRFLSDFVCITVYLMTTGISLLDASNRNWLFICMSPTHIVLQFIVPFYGVGSLICFNLLSFLSATEIILRLKDTLMQLNDVRQGEDKRQRLTQLLQNLEEIFFRTEDYNLMSTVVMSVTAKMFGPVLSLTIYVNLIDSPLWWRCLISTLLSYNLFVILASLYLSSRLYVASRQTVQKLNSVQSSLTYRSKNIKNGLLVRKFMKVYSSDNQPVCFRFPDGDKITPIYTFDFLGSTLSLTLLWFTNELLPKKFQGI